VAPFLINIYIYSCNKTQALQDWSAHVVPVSKPGEGTAFSIFDTSPESPDGKYICYVEYPQIVHGGYEVGIADVL